jgi:hypothetical protein
LRALPQVFGVLCSAAEAGPAMARVGDEIFKVRGILAQLQVVYMELSEVLLMALRSSFA